MKRRGSGSKPSRIRDKLEVTYSTYHWELLTSLRRQAVVIFESLTQWKETALVHGSLARGDIDDKSDIDVVIPVSIGTQLVEASLEAAGFQIASREIAQATPAHSPKAHIYLDPEQKTGVTIPLSPFRRLEEEFYKFGGTASWRELLHNSRNRGCTKKLTLIEPTESGHVESSIIGRESEVAGILSISPDIVRERVRVLGRRDRIGRTGIFLKLPVVEGASFEEALDQETRANPALRRTLRKRTAA